MSSLDFVQLSDIVSDGSAVHGVTAGLPSFSSNNQALYGFNSANSGANGAMALRYTNSAVFTAGATISAVLVRYPGQSNTGHSTFVFAGLNGNASGSSADQHAYMLGLADGSPGHIVLAKAPINRGLLDGSPGNFGILRKSTEVVELGTWVHLRLETAKHSSGDVFLNVYKNTNADFAQAPNWQPIPGMTQFIDDITQVNTGSQPLAAGPAGFGFKFSAQGCSGAVDHVQATYQSGVL